MDKSINNVIRNWGFLLVLFPLLLFALCIFCLLIGYRIFCGLPIITFISLIGVSSFFMKARISALLFAIAGIFFIVIASITIDYSFDGQWYHAATTYFLSEGWNPIYDPMLTDADMEMPVTAIWANHYAKALEIASSSLVCLTQNLESGKAINLFFVFGCFLLVLSELLDKLGTGWKSLFLSVILIFNPVVICQLFTRYIDWSCYIFILIAFICIFQLDKNFYKYSCLLCLLLFMAVSIKFNIAFWVVLFSSLFLSSKIFLKKPISKRERNLTIYLALSVLLGITLGGFNPYMLNRLNKGNFFYPLMGEGKVDIMTTHILDQVKGLSTFDTINLSIAMNPQNCSTDDYHIFSFSVSDYYNSGWVDARLGGFGVFFFESLLLSIIGTLILINKNARYFIAGGMLFLYVCLFILPSGWWARYVPFFYFSPLIYILYAIIKEEKFRFIAYTAAILLLMNIFMSSKIVFNQLLYQRTLVTNMLNSIHATAENPLQCSTLNFSFLNNLRQRNIPYIIQEPSENNRYCMPLSPIVKVSKSSIVVDD